MANEKQKSDPAPEAEEVAAPEIGDAVQFSSIPFAERFGGEGIAGMKEGPYAAIITRVVSNPEGEVTGCDLTIFPPNVPPMYERNVPMAGSADDDGARG